MKIVIIGMGNVLCRDKGVGVRAVQALEDSYLFPSNVDVMGGGVSGSALAEYVRGCDRLIIVDAVQGGRRPGTVYRFSVDPSDLEAPQRRSMHLEEVLAVLKNQALQNREIKTRVVGMEPRDVSGWGMGLSPTVERGMDALVETLIDELKVSGVPRELLVSRRSTIGSFQVSAACA